jgi:hypothetical protein
MGWIKVVMVVVVLVSVGWANKSGMSNTAVGCTGAD